MSLRSRVVTFNIGTGTIAGGTVTQDHFLGEAPKVILFFWCGSQLTGAGVAQGTTAGNWRAGFGFANCIPGTPVNACIAVNAANGVAAGARGSRQIVSAVSCVVVNSPSAASVTAALHVSAVSATQFTMMIDTQFSAAMRITAVCLSGEDITNVAVGVGTGPSATGNFDTTGLGFNPAGGGHSLLLLGCTQQATLETSENFGAQFSAGAAISSTERCVIGATARQAISPTSSKRYNYNAECAGAPSTVIAGDSTRKDFVAWIADGFRLNLLQLAIASERIPYCVIEGPRFAIKTGTTSGALNDRVAITGVGFRPDAGLVWSTHAALDAQDANDLHAVISQGAWSQRYDQQVMAGSDQDGVTTTVGAAAADYYGCYLGLTGAGAIESAMGLATIDADGATYYMSNATPVAAKNFFTVFMGPASSAPAARTTVASSHIWSWM